VTALQLASAASGQDKSYSALLNQAVDFIEKRGEFLNFVDDDRRLSAPWVPIDHRFEQVGVGGQPKIEIGP
jgi:hypothetical protein